MIRDAPSFKEKQPKTFHTCHREYALFLLKSENEVVSSKLLRIINTKSLQMRSLNGFSNSTA
jgi:hypothetical protein